MRQNFGCMLDSCQKGAIIFEMLLDNPRSSWLVWIASGAIALARHAKCRSGMSWSGYAIKMREREGFDLTRLRNDEGVNWSRSSLYCFHSTNASRISVPPKLYILQLGIWFLLPRPYATPQFRPSPWQSNAIYTPSFWFGHFVQLQQWISAFLSAHFTTFSGREITIIGRTYGLSRGPEDVQQPNRSTTTYRRGTWQSNSPSTRNS